MVGANLSRVDFSGANLTGVLWFKSNVSEAYISEHEKATLGNQQVVGLDETKEQKSPNTTTHQQTLEVHVEGNKQYSIHHISDSNISDVIMGENNRIMHELNSSGQRDLSQALEMLTKAITASQGLSNKDKEEKIGVINQIGEQAKAPSPNKTIIQLLTNGLLETLKVVPDLVSAVAAATPLLSNLHF